MAIGRQDYQAGVVPIKSGYSLSQTPVFHFEGRDIAAYGSQDFCVIPVGAGYKFVVCGYRVSGEWPYINNCWIKVDGTTVMFRRFDMDIVDYFPDGGQLVVGADKIFKITLDNRDEIQQNFSVIVLGYMEQIET